MDTKLLPIVHLQARAREILADQLAFEGVSEQGRADADALARQLWSIGTADIVMENLREVLPTAEYKALLAFCNDKYPILYSTHPISKGSVSIFHGLSTVPIMGTTCWSQLPKEQLGVLEVRADQSHHSARSQVRGRLHGGANEYRDGGAGVRVDGTASGPSGAILANKGEQRRRGGLKLMTRAGKRSFKRAIARARLQRQSFISGHAECFGAKSTEKSSASETSILQLERRWAFCGRNRRAGALLEPFQHCDSIGTGNALSNSGEWTKGDWTYIHSASSRARQDAPHELSVLCRGIVAGDSPRQTSESSRCGRKSTVGHFLTVSACNGSWKF